MSQVAGPSDDSQENNVHENAVVKQVKTQSFQLGTQCHTIRILGTEEDPWFVAADVGKVLGMDRVSHHLGNYKEGTEKGVRDIVTPGGVQKMIVLSEMAVYKFLMRSQKAEAEPFQDWVADVLRTIRLEGRYELEGKMNASQSKLLGDNAAFQRKFRLSAHRSAVAGTA